MQDRDGGLSLQPLMPHTARPAASRHFIPASLTLASFKLQELPWHSKVLQQARVHSEVALESAVSHAEDAMDQAPVHMHAALLDLQQTFKQAMANLMAWLDTLGTSTRQGSRQAEQTDDLAVHQAKAHIDVAVAAGYNETTSSALTSGRQMHCSVATSAQPAAPLATGLVGAKSWNGKELEWQAAT